MTLHDLHNPKKPDESEIIQAPISPLEYFSFQYWKVK